MMKRLAEHFITFRLFYLIAITVVTAFFGYHASRMEMETFFDDLFPQKHPYIKVHNAFEQLFGGANLVSIEFSVKEGDIFTTKNLEKVQRITEEVAKVPWVHPYQIVSIARPNVKDVKVTGWGMTTVPVMYPNVPQTEEELEELKNVVFHNDMIYGNLVSVDAKSTLIQAVFIKDPATGKDIDYRVVFDALNRIVEKEADEKTEISMSGNPVLYGWIYSYFNEMVFIFLLTVGVIVILLLVYFRNTHGVLVPMISGLVSALWGLGLAKLLRYNIDPLILVIPFVISARVVSHSVQMVRRFEEEFYRFRDKRRAAIESCAALFAPGFLGVITDAMGILVILVAPIPLLTKLGLMGSYWVLSIVVSVLMLVPIILSYFPEPRITKLQFQEDPVMTRVLGWIGQLPYARKSRNIIIAVSLVVLVVGGYLSKDLKIGDTKPGTPILWPDSEYNRATASINEKYPGTDQLFVIVEGSEDDIIMKPESVKLLEDFQWHMESLPEIGGTVSVADPPRKVNMAFHYGDPKWEIQSFHDAQYQAMLIFMFSQGTEPGEMDRYMSRDGRLANVICFVKDHRGETIDKVIKQAESFIKDNPSEKIKFKMAGGLIGVLAAANQVILNSETLCLILAFGVVFLTCAIAYRSFLAGFIFVVPLAASNYLTFAYMAWRDIGMNINTLPVSTLGIGLGVDYGIYIVSRMIEEYPKVRDYRQASINALSTSGGAVLFTGTTLIAGVIFWYFLSSLRFQAEMGLLLSLWMLISMLGGMVLIPTIVAIIKPKFIARGSVGSFV